MLNEEKIPNNLDEALELLDKELEGKERERVLSLESEDQFLYNLHFTLGMAIRNIWNLWGVNNGLSKNLYDYFIGLGIHHADDMSSIILTSLYRKIKGLSLDLEEQIRTHQNYWKEVKKEIKI